MSGVRFGGGAFAGIGSHDPDDTGDDDPGAGITVGSSGGAATLDTADIVAHKRAPAQLARHLRFVATGTTPSSGNTATLLKLGQPKVGRLWNVVYISVGGADATTVVTGATVVSYVGPLPPNEDPTVPVLAALLDPGNGTVVPNSASFNKDQVWVRRPDHLYLIVSGAPTSQALFAVVRVLEYAIDDREADPRPLYGDPLPPPPSPELTGSVALGGPTGIGEDGIEADTPAHVPFNATGGRDPQSV